MYGKRTYLSIFFRTVIFAVCLMSVQSLQAAKTFAVPIPSPTSSSNTASSNAGGWFSILSSNLEGEYLVIRYTVRYPGMVKVKMFSETEQLMWRSQYVNNKEGEHKIVLRAKYLDPGSVYTFEFDYKNHKERFKVPI